MKIQTHLQSRSPKDKLLSSLTIVIVLLIGLTGARSAHAQSNRPCDIFAAASPATPCVAAFSTVRVLFAAYSGSLYQVTRASDNTTSNIGVLSDGYANAAIQDAFCANTTCTITKIFDQSSNHNDLPPLLRGKKGLVPVQMATISRPQQLLCRSLRGDIKYTVYLSHQKSVTAMMRQRILRYTGRPKAFMKLARPLTLVLTTLAVSTLATLRQITVTMVTHIWMRSGSNVSAVSSLRRALHKWGSTWKTAHTVLCQEPSEPYL